MTLPPFIIPPLLLTIRAEADRLAPGRSHASDGIVGDAAHAARISDHNPDAITHVVHAIDLTHDPAHGFDAWHWAQTIRGRAAAGTERRVKYLVANDGAGADVIAEPPGWVWVQNGSPKVEHRTHLHVSILAGPAVEDSTDPFLIDSGGSEVTPDDLAAISRAVADQLDTKLSRAVELLAGTIHTAIEDHERWLMRGAPRGLTYRELLSARADVGAGNAIRRLITPATLTPAAATVEH